MSRPGLTADAKRLAFGKGFSETMARCLVHAVRYSSVLGYRSATVQALLGHGAIERAECPSGHGVSWRITADGKTWLEAIGIDYEAVCDGADPFEAVPK
jgi:hypothetical protein